MVDRHIINTTFRALLITAFASSANAQLTQNITLGNPKALSLGNAVTADPPGIDSIHFNPAGLAKLDGRNMQVKLLAAHIEYETKFGTRNIPQGTLDAYRDISGSDYPVDPLENTTSSTSDPGLVLPFVGFTALPILGAPFGGVSIEEEDYGWTFATAVYSAQAIGYERGENDPGAFQGQKMSATRLTYFSPSVAFHFNDELMLGASIGLSWQGFGITTKFRAPEATIAFVQSTAEDLPHPPGQPALQAIGPYDTIGTLEMEMEDALAFSFNVGLLWEPTEWLAFGAVFQSESVSELEGDFTMTYTESWNGMLDGLLSNGLLRGALTLLNEGTPFNNAGSETGAIKLDLTHPAHFSMGTSIRILPEFKLNLDAKWVDYGAWNSLDFIFSKPVDFLSLSNIVYQFGPSKGDGDNADPNVMRIQRQYESVWSWAIGAEYQFNDRIVLRAGYEPRKSAIPDNRVDILVPISEADLYSVGGGYRWDKDTTIDVAVAILDSSYDIAAGESQNSNSDRPGRVVYNPYAFLPMKNQTTAYFFTVSYESKF